MRIGVRLGPVSLSTSTHSRRRSRSSQPGWHATGHATTPDAREVDFRCHHNHRSQSAALDCASTTRKQIERGQNLHLVTRVRSTPASREAARQRALKQEAERQAKAAQRTQAAQQRAQRREAAAQQRAQQKEALALQHGEPELSGLRTSSRVHPERVGCKWPARKRISRLNSATRLPERLWITQVIASVARGIGVSETTLGNWVRAYRDRHAGEEPPLELSERARLREAERESGNYGRKLLSWKK